MNVHEKSGLLRLNLSRTASSARELLAHVQLSLHRTVIAQVTLVITYLQLLLIHRNCYGDYIELYIHVLHYYNELQVIHIYFM